MELSKEVKGYLKLRKKLMVLEYAKRCGSVAKALKVFEVPKATYYKWKKILIKTAQRGCCTPNLNNHFGRINVFYLE